MRVLFHYAAAERVRDSLADLLDGLDVAWCAEDDDAGFAAALPDTEVLWHVLRPVSAADFARAPRLRLVQKLGSGVNTIDRAAAAAHGVAVSNMIGQNAESVAESALALLLACTRRLVELDRATRAGAGWPLDPALAGELTEVAGQTVGLVGYGAIARRFGDVLRALGARVRYTTATARRAEPDWAELDVLLAGADIVSLHLPLTEQTAGLLDERRLGLLRPGAILINTARGGLVDQRVLVAALRSGRLAAAGLDVFADEPAAPDDPLFALPNVVLTPHVAWLSGQSLRRCVAAAADNVRRLAAGEPLHNVIAPPAPAAR